MATGTSKKNSTGNPEEDVAPQNRLLSGLSSEEYTRLARHMETVHLELKHVAFEPNQPIEFAYFPLTEVISIVTPMQGRRAVEVATVGREGMVGLPLFLGVNRTPNQAFTQVAGESIRIKADEFKKEVERQGGFAKLLHLYTQALLVQISQATACNGIHSIKQRAARWILTTHDRVTGRTFPLSQEFLSQMLSVRRAGVSEVASKLQEAGLIRYSRGMMEVLNRAGLEAVSCECHGVIQQEFDRLFGPWKPQWP